MEVEALIRIGYLTLIGLSVILNIIMIFAYLIKWKKNRKAAKTPEEKNEADEIMKTNINVAIANIKANLDKLNLKFSNKALKQAFKEELKKEG